MSPWFKKKLPQFVAAFAGEQNVLNDYLITPVIKGDRHFTNSVSGSIRPG